MVSRFCNSEESMMVAQADGMKTGVDFKSE